MNYRKYLIVALAFSIAVASAPLALAQTKAPIKLAVGVDAAYVPMYLSKQGKLFEKHGVNVELIQFAQGGESLDALAAGQVSVGSAAEPTTLIRAARADIKVLGIFGQSATYIKLVVKAGITDPKQLKKLGVVLGSVSEYSTERMLNKYGIDPKSVEIIKVGPPEAPALLARGDLDGYFLWEPWPTNGVKQGGKILLTSGDVGYVDNLWLSADAAWLAAHPAEAKAILAALAEACTIVRADPARAAAAVQAEAKIPVAIALEILKERECVVRDFTPADMESYDKIADFLVSRKITPTKVDLGKVLQRGFYIPK
jgi:NitT/TauT family transport system substrate-binding protein